MALPQKHVTGERTRRAAGAAPVIPGFQSFAAALAAAAGEDALVACEVAWAEVATAYAPDEDVADDLRALGLRFEPMSELAALRAAKVRVAGILDGTRIHVNGRAVGAIGAAVGDRDFVRAQCAHPASWPVRSDGNDTASSS